MFLQSSIDAHDENCVKTCLNLFAIWSYEGIWGYIGKEEDIVTVGNMMHFRRTTIPASDNIYLLSFSLPHSKAFKFDEFLTGRGRDDYSEFVSFAFAFLSVL